jgi:hypothetical protein
MEKAAAAGTAGVRWESAAFLALACAVAPAWAQDGGGLPAEVLLAEARVEPQVRMQVQTSALPRLDAQDAGFQAPRVDVSLFPSPRTGLGAMLGLSLPRAAGPGLQPPAPGGVDLGLRWTHRLLGQQQIDVMAWRRMNAEHDAYTMTLLRDPTVYAARVELNLTPVRKMGLAADRGFLGLQLQSGARISIKRKNGGPMVYYRTSF